MNEWMILHQVMMKTVIGYPLLMGIIGFCIFETMIESIIRKEKRLWEEEQELKKQLS